MSSSTILTVTVLIVQLIILGSLIFIIWAFVKERKKLQEIINSVIDAMLGSNKK
jgi:hypothetical protein